MVWNYIPKLQRFHSWSLGIDKQFHPTIYDWCNYLSMLGLKLFHVSKRGHRGPFYWHRLTEIMTWMSNYVRSFIVSLSLIQWIAKLARSCKEQCLPSPSDLRWFRLLLIGNYVCWRSAITQWESNSNNARNNAVYVETFFRFSTVYFLRSNISSNRHHLNYTCINMKCNNMKEVCEGWKSLNGLMDHCGKLH